jgi:glucokinase
MAARAISVVTDTGCTLALGIDLGGTQIRAAIVDRSGMILKRASEATRADAGPEIVIAQIVALASSVCEGFGRQAIGGAGFSAPGPLDTAEGLALDIPTLKGFVEFPLRDALSQKLGMPVALENDGVAAALGEWRFGAARGIANLVYVTVSTGIGGGVIIDNRVLRARRGMAGHVGHMSFVRGGEICFCGNRGCFEAYGSGSAFTRRAIAAANNGEKTLLGTGREPIDAAVVFAAAKAGDALAMKLVREEAEILGEGFASLLHLYSPDLLVMGGGISNQFAMLQDGIMSSMRRCAMPPFRNTPVVRAALGNDSGLVGAASLVFANP